MRVKMILPALAEALSFTWRPLKYSLFPPLGPATLASYLCAYRDFYRWSAIWQSAVQQRQ